MKSGLLIVLEGIDGAGKSTQVRGLVRRLRYRGFDVLALREPTRGRYGREIRRNARTDGSLTPRQELGLFLQDRRENVAKNILPALAAGRIVVMDRFYYSTVAYQGAKGLDPGELLRANESFAPNPDLVFFLDLPAARGLDRIGGRKTRDLLFEREGYLRRVRRIFRGFQGRRFVHLDAGRNRRELADEILDRVLKLRGPRAIKLAERIGKS
jgi:dTMP kinase